MKQYTYRINSLILYNKLFLTRDTKIRKQYAYQAPAEVYRTNGFVLHSKLYYDFNWNNEQLLLLSCYIIATGITTYVLNGTGPNVAPNDHEIERPLLFTIWDIGIGIAYTNMGYWDWQCIYEYVIVRNIDGNNKVKSGR